MTAYIFDVDGVLTDPQTKKVEYNEIFNQIIIRLKKGYPISLNTGRSIEWLTYNILNQLISKVSDYSIFIRFIAIGEKGATWAIIDNSLHVQHGKLDNLSVPKYIINEASVLVSS